MPRITPIASPADLPPAAQPVAEAVLAVFGAIRGPFSMLLHSPDLAARVLPLVPFLREHSVVPGPLRSLAILATVREREADYVWSAQVRAARQNGLREAAIDVLRTRGDLAALEPEERDIVTYARQLVLTNRVEPAVFQTLLDRYGAQWLVELTTAASFYGMLCGVANAFEVAVPEGGDRF
jgi:4-carboxymuconolactone decarboxylase